MFGRKVRLPFDMGSPPGVSLMNYASHLQTGLKDEYLTVCEHTQKVTKIPEAVLW